MHTKPKFQALRLPAFVVGLGLLVVACNSSGGSAPQAPTTATPQNDASSSSLGAGAGSGSSDSSSIFGGSSSDTPQSIRSEQVTELKAEISRYENQLEYALSDRDGMLSNTLPSVEQRIIPNATTPTLLGGITTAAGDVVTGGVLTGLGESSGSGSTATPGNSAASGAGGDFSAGFGALGAGVAATQQTAAIQSTTAQITANVQGEIDQLNAEIKDLQTKIASLEQQVDTLIAQGT